MKITRLETIPVQVPIKPEFAIRSGRGGSHTVSPFLLVKIHTDAGLFGLGEISCTPRWSGEDQFTAAHFINRYLAPLLVGESPLEIGTLTARFRQCFAANFFTKAGVEMALWDLAGKAAGKPVWELLGGKVRDEIPIKWSVSGVASEKAADIARWAADQGFVSMKVKVGIEAEGDVARVQAVRKAVGSGIKLGVDANGGWDVETAVQTVKRLQDLGVYFAEQPVAPENPLDLASVRKRISIFVVADESVYSLGDARVLAALKAADVFSIYVGKAGGISSARAIADFAEESGLRCTVGSNLELGVGSAAMIHLAASTRGIDAESLPCDIIGPLFYEHDLLTERLPIGGGCVQAINRPGLGVELDEAAVRKYRV